MNFYLVIFIFIFLLSGCVYSENPYIQDNDPEAISFLPDNAGIIMPEKVIYFKKTINSSNTYENDIVKNVIFLERQDHVFAQFTDRKSNLSYYAVGKIYGEAQKLEDYWGIKRARNDPHISPVILTNFSGLGLSKKDQWGRGGKPLGKFNKGKMPYQIYNIEYLKEHFEKVTDGRSFFQKFVQSTYVSSATSAPFVTRFNALEERILIFDLDNPKHQSDFEVLKKNIENFGGATASRESVIGKRAISLAADAILRPVCAKIQTLLWDLPALGTGNGVGSVRLGTGAISEYTYSNEQCQTLFFTGATINYFITNFNVFNCGGSSCDFSLSLGCRSQGYGVAGACSSFGSVKRSGKIILGGGGQAQSVVLN